MVSSSECAEAQGGADRKIKNWKAGGAQAPFPLLCPIEVEQKKI